MRIPTTALDYWNNWSGQVGRYFNYWRRPFKKHKGHTQSPICFQEWNRL